MRPALMLGLAVALVASATGREGSEPRTGSMPIAAKGYRALSGGSLPPRKHRIVAITKEARIVVADGRSGKEVATLVDRSGEIDADREFPLEAIALAPNRRDIYFTEVINGRRHIIQRVPIRGGKVRPVMPTKGSRSRPAAAPSISPDGTKLAFSFPTMGPATNHNAIGVLDLDSGEITRWRLDEDEEDFFQVGGHIYSSSWSPDGTRIAYYLEYEGPELHVLDVESDQSLSDNDWVEAGYLRSVDWVDGDRVVTVKSCCFPEWKRAPGRVVVVDIGTDQVTRKIETSRPAATVTLDQDRERYLVLLKNGALERTSGEDHAKKLGTGYTAADW